MKYLYSFGGVPGHVKHVLDWLSSDDVQVGSSRVPQSGQNFIPAFDDG